MEILTRDSEKIERYGLGYKGMQKINLNGYNEYEKIREDHPLYKKIVKEVLDNWSPATNNDFLLYIEVLRVLKKISVENYRDEILITIPKRNIAQIPQSESVTRARRSLNQKGECLPTNKEVLLSRSLKCKAMTKYMAENKQ